MKIFSIANQKGGCGKTTTAVNLAAALASLGSRVLLIDLDAQGHSTIGLGFSPAAVERTIYDAITRPNISISSVCLDTSVENLKLCPSNILLSGSEFELAPLYGREYILSQKINHLHESFDYCIIDCSPSLSLLTLNALVASTKVIIPVQTNYYAMEGLKQLLETLDIVRDRFNSQLEIAGILLTFVERTTLSRQISEQMRDYFGDIVFRTVIHRNVRLAEAPSVGESVLTYAPQSAGSCDYIALAKELTYEAANRIGQEGLDHI
jgi:chromosome partitioning protein